MAVVAKLPWIKNFLLVFIAISFIGWQETITKYKFL